MAVSASAPPSPGMALAEHPRFGKVWPGVLEAVNLIGSTQVQGRASAGGNLCNGSPAGDSVPAMVAAGAIVTVQGPNGRREMPVEKVPAGPGRTNLMPGEILVSFTLPPRPKGSERCLSAHDPAHRNGHRRGRRRRQPHAEGRRLHRRPGRARRGGADRAAGRGGREGADRQQARRCGAECRGRRLLRRLPSDRRQARHHCLPHQGRRRAAEAHRRDRRPTRPKGIKIHGQSCTFPPPSTASRRSFCASPATPCSMRCAGRSA